ncbi:hypothetical protein KY290_006190 [Solanum tuberosum]|uniref:Glycosyltransferase N-terminal domain-containing protein n=1 Tax=Solanum tuberosum TaxID=4113 RepID=A0ABQ7WGC8_SOLTU|nr:hypothetical protein KY284_006298 [Solanum tuberosum]KAH0779763.1 hypothetical protein KY290_006190 [Solanum tuberosum]
MPSLLATCHLRHPISSLLHELSRNYRRVIVIYDSLIAWVLQDAPSILNVECYSFRSVSGFTIYSFICDAAGRLPADAENEFLEKNSSMEGCFTSEFAEFSRVQTEFREMVNSGDLYNSCYEIEGLYLDLLAKEKSAEPNSVIFASFGTTTTLSDEEIKELAIGLEKSEKKFIWVLREADKGDIFTGESREVELPEGYEEKVEKRGLIVRDWVPQLEILRHESTGGFMSHCGWNSCMESISMGVPIVAWPMHSDQPRNAILVTEVLKIGVVLKDWAMRDELVSSDAVAEGDKMRQRATELSKSVVNGGGSGKEMDSFIAHITR